MGWCVFRNSWKLFLGNSKFEGGLLRHADGIEFSTDAKGTVVESSWPPDQTLDDAATYLLGFVCAFVLRLRGVTALHAHW